MELLQLRYFRTVAHYESITKAADYYHIPQPAMSQSIARLEKELGGIRLFDRKSSRLFLNEKGRIFLASVEKALDELDNGINSVTVDQSRIAGSVSLVVMENRRFILSCVSSFSALYPDVNFSISHSYDQDQSCDLCISSVQNYRQMRSFAPLIREPFVVALHEQHPLADQPVISLDDLKEEKFISLPPKSAQYVCTMEQCHLHGFEPNIPFICDDEYYVRKYISEKMGIALSPSVSWAGRFRTNTRTIPLTQAPVTTSYLIWDDSKYQSPAVKAFSAYLLKEAAAIPENMIEH